MAFDAWGKRRNINGESDPLDQIQGVYQDRGYTMHEMMDEMGLIHMNGRVYDPYIGRFMSPDPTVPHPFWLQSFNRYSYVMNNPLSLIDPSGYDPEGPEDNYDLSGPSEPTTTETPAPGDSSNGGGTTVAGTPSDGCTGSCTTYSGTWEGNTFTGTSPNGTYTAIGSPTPGTNTGFSFGNEGVTFNGMTLTSATLTTPGGETVAGALNPNEAQQNSPTNNNDFFGGGGNGGDSGGGALGLVNDTIAMFDGGYGKRAADALISGNYLEAGAYNLASMAMWAGTFVTGGVNTAVRGAVGAAARSAPTVAKEVSQYSLRALTDGMYPVFARGSSKPVGQVFLQADDVWKYGITVNPSYRYSQAQLNRWGVYLSPEIKFQSRPDARIMEQFKIDSFRYLFDDLPAGNKVRF